MASLFKHTALASIALGCCLAVQAGPVESTLIDPTRPLSYSPAPAAAATSSNFQLESILYSSNRKVVVINQTVLGQGDKLGGIEVTRINPDSVEIKQGGKARTLALPKTQVKTAPTTNNHQDY